MARVVEEKVIVVMSRLVPNNTNMELASVLDAEQLETLQKAVEGLVDDSSVVVEIVA